SRVADWSSAMRMTSKATQGRLGRDSGVRSCGGMVAVGMAALSYSFRNVGSLDGLIGCFLGGL
ncbi:MAG: hypothetical protein ACI84E_001561, partial [Planctomycetota bacterium]